MTAHTSPFQGGGGGTKCDNLVVRAFFVISGLFLGRWTWRPGRFRVARCVAWPASVRVDSIHRLLSVRPISQLLLTSIRNSRQSRGTLEPTSSDKYYSMVDMTSPCAFVAYQVEALNTSTTSQPGAQGGTNTNTNKKAPEKTAAEKEKEGLAGPCSRIPGHQRSRPQGPCTAATGPQPRGRR